MDPISLFRQWYDQALQCEIMPQAASLATVDAQGYPHVRMVLVKEPFVFYTHLNSPKGRQIHIQDHIALCFYWAVLRRQVRIEGICEQVDADLADIYFAKRPRESQVNAWVSRQSEPIPEGTCLEDQMAQKQLLWEKSTIPRPPFWSGYTTMPLKMEFWEERAHRCHKRLVFERKSRHDAWISYSVFP